MKDNYFANLLKFFPEFLEYITLRSRQIYVWSSLIVEYFFLLGANIKKEVVKRMFWGRNSFYRKAFHTTIITITIFTLLNSISQRISIQGAEQKGLNIDSGEIGHNDTLLQYANSQTFTVKSVDDLPFDVVDHTVKDGETLESIAKFYKIDDVTSIQWANGLDPFNTKIKPGQILKIPPMKGVLKQVKKGDTLSTVLENVKNSNKIDVIELNNLEGPDYALLPGQVLFIPNGDIPLPNPKSGGSKGGSGVYIDIPTVGIDVPPGTFVNPLSDSSCSGYGFSRGWSYHHTGVDLTKKDGCWISATREGEVMRARWCEGGLGFCVIIKHPDGFSTLYAHGNGTYAVQEGDRVKAGQKIMYMGNSGNSFGTHLHFSLSANDNNVITYSNRINPKDIIPY